MKRKSTKEHIAEVEKQRSCFRVKDDDILYKRSLIVKGNFPHTYTVILTKNGRLADSFDSINFEKINGGTHPKSMVDEVIFSSMRDLLMDGIPFKIGEKVDNEGV